MLGFKKRFLSINRLTTFLVSPLILAELIGCRGQTRKDMGIEHPNRITVEFARRISLEESMEATIGQIADVVVDSSGNLFIGDNSDGKVKKFDASGKFLGSLSRAADTPFVITGLCLDEEGSIYVSDVSTYSILRYSSTGKLIDKFRTDDSTLFFLGMCRVYNTRLYVGTLEKRFDPSEMYRSTLVGIYDGMSGHQIGRFGFYDTNYKELCPLSPEARFDIDMKGNVYIVQRNSPRVFRFDSDGRYLSTFDSHPSDFVLPTTPMPRHDFDRRFEWMKGISSMDYVKAVDKYVLTQFVNYNPKGSFLSVYSTTGEVFGSELSLPGKLRYAYHDSLYVEVDSTENNQSMGTRIDVYTLHPKLSE